MGREVIIKQATKYQHSASAPGKSVWVSASAGTGKTHVLTQRILRLLLADKSLKASGILALTFTKAAAREMENRVQISLANWATCEERELVKTLEIFLAKPPTDADIAHARNLFFKVLDDPHGLGVATIHGFCQKLLSRFPLEAGVPTGFKVMEDAQRRHLLSTAQDKVFETFVTYKNIPNWAFTHLASNMGEMHLRDIFASFINKYTRFRAYLRRSGGVDNALLKLAMELEIPAGLTPDDLPEITTSLFNFTPKRIENLNQAVEALNAGGKRAQWRGQIITNALIGNGCFSTYSAAFLKYASTLVDKPTLNAGGEKVAEFLLAEQSRVQVQAEKSKRLDAYLITASYLYLGVGIMETYDELKAESSLLDFDDLIDKTSTLIADKSRGEWVRYRMDSQITHILLDESQDIDHAQWQIVKSLSDEFFAGIGTKDNKNRTMFAVGDVKQSIYRFRGAKSEVFDGMYDYMKASTDKSLRVDMDTSFRSSAAILKIVDQVFSAEDCGTAIGGNVSSQGISHVAAFSHIPGRVEIWPLTEVEKEEKYTKKGWQMPAYEPKVSSATAVLAGDIAKSINGLLNNKATVTDGDKTRVVTPGDIMILLRSRTMMGEILAALERENLPHSGADTLPLNDDPIIADMLALSKFLANPSDELSLAHTLRSPLFGFSDDDLINLRMVGKNLWPALFGSTTYNLAKNILTDLLERADILPPYDLLVRALALTNGRGKFAICFSMPLSAVHDILDLFLDIALNFEWQNTSSLAGFIHEIENNPTSIKRESTAGGVVRVLTVHGSKGLEAPIVYLPDTTSSFYGGLGKETCLWQENETGIDDLFIYKRPKTESCDLQNNMLEDEKTRIFADEMRLLYVALTRARERLYICGIMPRVKGESWYTYINNAAEKFANDWESEGSTKVLRHLNFSNVTLEKNYQPKPEVIEKLPSWLQVKAVKQPAKMVVRASSSLISSLVENESSKVYSRGLLLHRLLEVIPTYLPDEREEKAYIYLQNMNIEQNISAKLVNKVLVIIATFPELFGENSRPEVSLVAFTSKGRLDGIVDRLVITDKEVIVIDYKTDKKVPSSTSIPASYKRQLSIYREALEHIFINKKVKAGILWVSADPCRVDFI